MTHQPDHENTADKAAVTPPPALTTEGRLRARVQTLEEDAERNQGLAKVGARCMREGHQGLIESGRATVEGHRFALSVKLGLGTDATWDAIHERVKELRVDSAEPAAVSAAVAPPTNPTHGLSVPHADALWDAVAIPGPHTPTYPEQHERVCRAVRDILDELTPARDDTDAQTALRDRIADKLTAAAYECDGKCGLSERECYDAHPITFSAMAGGTTHVDGSVTAIADAVLAALPSAADWDDLVREADRLRRDGAALHARAEEIDTQLTALRQQVAEPADRAAVLADVERAIRAATRSCGYKAEDGCDFCNGVAAALDQVRRMADETATETPQRERVKHSGPDTKFCVLCLSGEHERVDEPAAGARQDGAET